MTDDDAKQTPLTDLLRGVPADAVLLVDHGVYESSSYPVGRMCHEAAAAIELQNGVAAHWRLRLVQWLREKAEKVSETST